MKTLSSKKYYFNKTVHRCNKENSYHNLLRFIYDNIESWFSYFISKSIFKLENKKYYSF